VYILYTRAWTIKDWNALPGDIKRSKNVTGFKKAYRKLLRHGPDGMPDENRDGQ
jgi:hypothetical protein